MMCEWNEGFDIDRHYVVLLRMPRSVVIFVFVFSLGSVRYIDDDEIEMVHRITIEKGQCLCCRCQLLNPLRGRLLDTHSHYLRRE